MKYWSQIFFVFFPEGSLGKINKRGMSLAFLVTYSYRYWYSPSSTSICLLFVCCHLTHKGSYCLYKGPLIVNIYVPHSPQIAPCLGVLFSITWWGPESVLGYIMLWCTCLITYIFRLLRKTVKLNPKLLIHDGKVSSSDLFKGTL